MQKLNFWIAIQEPKWHILIRPLIHLHPPPPPRVKLTKNHQQPPDNLSGNQLDHLFLLLAHSSQQCISDKKIFSFDRETNSSIYAIFFSGNKLCSQDQNDAEEEFTFSGPKLYQSKSLKREKNLAKSQLNPGGQKHADEELSFTGPKLFASKSLKRGSHKNMINYIEELNKDPQEEQCENSGGEDESEKNSIGSKFRVSKYRGLRAASFLEEVRASLDQQSPDDIGS